MDGSGKKETSAKTKSLVGEEDVFEFSFDNEQNIKVENARALAVSCYEKTRKIYTTFSGSPCLYALKLVVA